MAQKEFFVSNNWTAINNPGYPSVDVKINRLVHVTHITNAENIISSHFKFDASSKYGRSNDSSYKLDRKPQDEQLSWRDIVEKKGGRFSRVSCMESLICDGRFIWWGIEVDCEAINSVKREGRDLSMLFTNESYYGTVGFSVPFDEVIESYKSSFKPGGKVLFKKAGTLGYKKETCYVILVCVQEEGKGDPLPQFITVPEYTTGSSVHITNPYRNTGFRWNTYDFAFFYPEDKESKFFILNDTRKVTLFQAEHNGELCLKKILDNRELKCPDEVTKVTFDDLHSLKNSIDQRVGESEIQDTTNRADDDKEEENDEEESDDDNEEDSGDDESEDDDSNHEFDIQGKAPKRKREDDDSEEETDTQETNKDKKRKMK